ncbi:MAG: VOC family protein [Clostridiales bacterium]|nr:VOC family protein [Clostridiales bacterium]
MTIDHINRHVSSVDAFISFYTDALGFILLDKGVKKDGNHYAILQGGGLELFISEKYGFEFDDGSNMRHIGFSVDSADALLASLKEKGYVPKETHILVKASSRQFYVKDPDGFELDFIEWTDKNKFYRHLADKNADTSR